MAKAWLGIDWGTHSSKWCYRAEGEKPLVGIWDSRVWRLGEHMAMFPMARRFSAGDVCEGALKRILIRDPGQAYWSGDRPRLGVSLGQAVVFSLYVLILDAMKTAKARDLPMPGSEELEIRFAHPNWLSPEDMVALRYLRDAAVVAAVRVFDWAEHRMEDEGLQIAIAALKEWATEDCHRSYGLPEVPAAFEYDTYSDWSMGITRGIRWRLVFESCAAGFSYLADEEPEVFDQDGQEVQLPRRKLLVVDIGAGSTDSGYLLRTIPPSRDGQDAPEPLLIWLPPAPTLTRAGKWLSDRIRSDWRQQGRHATEAEVEDYKTSGTVDWYDRAYVADWCRSIADHLASYMRDVPDDDRLPRNPPLEIVLTGGSSVVRPVREVILGGVIAALRERGIGIAGNTRFLQVGEDLTGPAGEDEVERAQLAVSLGAAHPKLVKLRHFAKGLRQPPKPLLGDTQ